MLNELPTPHDYQGATSVGESRATTRRADLMRKRADAYANALTQAMAHNRALERNLEATQERCTELLLEGRAQRNLIRKMKRQLDALLAGAPAAVSSPG